MGRVPLLRFAQWRERLIAAEQSGSWLDQCDEEGRFLAVSRELVDALAAVLGRLAGDAGVLEVCAGSGHLAPQLLAAGVRMRATDAKPPTDSRALHITAPEALRRFQPEVVLGVFVPFDAGVDEAVLGYPSVKHYVVLNARIGGSLGSPVLWNAAQWRAEPLDEVRRWMLTRHDVWLGADHDGVRLLQHGEAWHLARRVVPDRRGGRT
jgi:hypothetical protein